MKALLPPAAIPTLALGLFLFAGCSSLSGDPRADEIATLKKQLVEQQRNATVGEVEVARLRGELARAKAALREAEEKLARRSSDDTLRADTPIERTSPPVIDQSELDERVPEAIELAPAAEIAAQPVSSAEDPQVLYDRGYTLFHQKSYDLAEAAFRTFLDRYPSSDLADNALFWIGESHYARGDFQNALNAFAQTVARFPQGNKVSDALLKAGRCLELLGRPEEATNTYREIQERYPGSVAAAGAQERLAALGVPSGKR